MECTLHILLPLKHHKRISLRLRFPRLLVDLVRRLVALPVINHNPHAINRTKPPELPLQILDVRIEAQSPHKERLERVAPNRLVFRWLVQLLEPITLDVLLVRLFLQGLSVAFFEPGFGGLVLAELLFQLREVGGDAGYGFCLPVFRREVGGWEVAEGGARGEEGEEVGWEFVRHGGEERLRGGCLQVECAARTRCRDAHVRRARSIRDGRSAVYVRSLMTMTSDEKMGRRLAVACR